MSQPNNLEPWKQDIADQWRCSNDYRVYAQRYLGPIPEGTVANFRPSGLAKYQNGLTANDVIVSSPMVANPWAWISALALGGPTTTLPSADPQGGSPEATPGPSENIRTGKLLLKSVMENHKFVEETEADEWEEEEAADAEATTANGESPSDETTLEDMSKVKGKPPQTSPEN